MSKGSRALSILATALAAVAFGGSQSLADIAGGGKGKSDCYAVFEGIEANKGKIGVQCIDGDPTCDSDGGCNNSCTFSFQVCVNSDKVPGCTSPGVTGYKKNQVKGKNVTPAALTVPTPTSDTNSCATSSEVVVPLKQKGSKLKKGKGKVKLITDSSGKPKRDPDKLKLFCLPREGTCPPQPTTSTSVTTTTSSTSTTSTIDPGILCCEIPGSSPAVSATFASVTTSNTPGDCGDIIDFTGAKNADIACAGLYFGGGGNSVPLPAIVPDQGQAVTAITDCTVQTATLGPTTSAETGSNRNCTSVGCLFGAPLSIPNAASTPTSTCVINTASTDASGTMNCATGHSDVAVPLTSEVFLTGDLDGVAAGIQPCPRCIANVCENGPNDGLPCTPETTTLGGNPAYPTSHDCPPDVSVSLGGLPIGFALTTGTVSWTALPSGSQGRVFSGFCRDADFAGSFANPAEPCFENGTVLAACAQPNESCEQRDQGAFGPAGGGRKTITAIGTPSGNLTAAGPHNGVLVSVFSIPPTFDATVDAAGNLPGPGATALPGSATLCSTANPCQ